MKKIILSFCTVVAAATAVNAQTSFGLEVGGLGSNYPGKDHGETLDLKAKFGFRAGVLADVGLSDNFYLQPAMMYVMNGFKHDAGPYHSKATVNTLEIPVNIQYKFGDVGDGRFFVGLGPYIAFNLGGKGQTDDSYTTTDFTYSIGNDATHDDIKRTDFGIGLNAGYQIDNGLFFRAHYQRGFVNLLPGGDANNTEFSTNYGVSVGYLFGAGGAHKHSKTTTVRVHRN